MNLTVEQKLIIREALLFCRDKTNFVFVHDITDETFEELIDSFEEGMGTLGSH